MLYQQSHNWFGHFAAQLAVLTSIPAIITNGIFTQLS